MVHAGRNRRRRVSPKQKEKLTEEEENVIAILEFQEAIVSVVSAGFPFNHVMNMPYTSFMTLLEIVQRTRAKRNIEMLYLMTAPHGDGSLIDSLLTENTTVLATYTSDAVSESVEQDIKAFNNYLGGLS